MGLGGLRRFSELCPHRPGVPAAPCQEPEQASLSPVAGRTRHCINEPALAPLAAPRERALPYELATVAAVLGTGVPRGTALSPPTSPSAAPTALPTATEARPEVIPPSALPVAPPLPRV